jgi:hypothetical protein
MHRVPHPGRGLYSFCILWFFTARVGILFSRELLDRLFSSDLKTRPLALVLGLPAQQFNCVWNQIRHRSQGIRCSRWTPRQIQN